MNRSSGSSAVWGILAAIVMIVALIGGSLYLIGDVSTRHARAVADQENARAQIESARAQMQIEIARAQVELARAHEEGSTERAQVFALTLKSLSNDNQPLIVLLTISLTVLAVAQLVQILLRPRGGS